MKILVVHGSMRKGNTYALTREITGRLLAMPDVELNEIFVSDLGLPFCCSCHLCFEKGEENCPHYGIMQGVKAAFDECDGVIISGVSYMWAPNAAIKNLLDHMAYGFHRPAFFGKKGMVISTAAGVGEKAVAKYLKTVLGQWGINGALIFTQNAKQRELQGGGEAAKAKAGAKLDRAAERFYSLIKSGRPLPPSVKNITVHNSFRVMSLSGYSGSERDTLYWQQDGFHNKAYPVKAGPVYLIGAIMHGLVRFMLKIVGGVYEKRR